ncbi:MAG TPA: prepilin-type N-terminal cleavage/methylation domain-containing protein [Syntrophales bacterium]|nr:prepilin-type N-terminal cleavage/methylation domain-containing protein [Syntrophales bacterium]
MIAVKKSGFTLVEILIAIAILTIVMGTVYAAYMGTFGIVEDTQSGNTVYRSARSTMARMIIDLESVCRYDDSFRFISEEFEIADNRFMNLSFFSSAHLDPEYGDVTGIAQIGYYIEEEGEEGPTLMREDTVFKDSAENEDTLFRGEGFILCEGLRSVTYTFYDTKGEEYDSWHSGLEPHKNKIPSIIAIHLEFTNPDDAENPYRFMTKVFLPMVEKP